MTHSKEEHKALYLALLASDDDVALFTRGGCGIFARALYEQFGYPMHYIPGAGGAGVSHVFCLLKTDQEYAIDVIGTKLAYHRLWDFAGDVCAPPMSIEELAAKSCALGQVGFLGDSWFVEPATKRAHARIQRYAPYFDGTKKEVIPA